MNNLITFLCARLDAEEEWLDPFAPDVDRRRKEIEAKRAIIELQQDRAVSDVPDEVLLILAAVYAGHPDYQPEWKP